MMSVDTGDCDRDGGDVVSFKEYMELWIEGHDKAEVLARDGVNHRLEGMNAIREQLATQKAEFATKEYIDGKLDAMGTKVEALKNVCISALFTAILGLALLILGHLLKGE